MFLNLLCIRDYLKRLLAKYTTSSTWRLACSRSGWCSWRNEEDRYTKALRILFKYRALFGSLNHFHLIIQWTLDLHFVQLHV